MSLKRVFFRRCAVSWDSWMALALVGQVSEQIKDLPVIFDDAAIEKIELDSTNAIDSNSSRPHSSSSR